jgi:hypothetical protein
LTGIVLPRRRNAASSRPNRSAVVNETGTKATRGRRSSSPTTKADMSTCSASRTMLLIASSPRFHAPGKLDEPSREFFVHSANRELLHLAVSTLIPGCTSPN